MKMKKVLLMLICAASISTVAISGTTVQAKELSKEDYLSRIENLVKSKSAEEYNNIDIDIENSKLTRADKDFLINELCRRGDSLIWTKDYIKAVDSVVKAWNKPNNENIDKAEDDINKVKIQVNKDYLFGELAKIKSKMPANKEIKFGREDFKITGVLSTPQEKTDTLVIIVGGSGQTDKDCTVGPNKPYLDIAKGLNDKGIAVLRYDKRNLTYAQKMSKLPATVWDEYIEDVLSAVKYFRDNKQFKRIYVAGHSEGGYVIPMIDKMAKDVTIDGYINLAASANHIEDIFVCENEYGANLDGKVTEYESKIIEFIKRFRDNVKGITNDSNYNPVSGIPKDYWLYLQNLQYVPKEYWLYLKDYNPIEDAKKIDKPMLYLNGKRDWQVPVETEFKMYKDNLESKKNCTFKVYDGLNHLFIKGEGATPLQDYDIKGHVEKAVIDDIADWLNKIQK